MQKLCYWKKHQSKKTKKLQSQKLKKNRTQSTHTSRSSHLISVEKLKTKDDTKYNMNVYKKNKKNEEFFDIISIYLARPCRKIIYAGTLKNR